MSASVRTGAFEWVPPQDHRFPARLAGEAWRKEASRLVAPRGPGVHIREVGVDVEFEPAAPPIDLPGVVLQVLAGLSDRGTVSTGPAGVDVIMATQRVGEGRGAAVSLIWTPAPRLADPFLGGAVLEVVGAAGMAGWPEEKAWDAALSSAWAGSPVVGAVGIDIESGAGTSIADLLGPLVDALGPYLGPADVGGEPARARVEAIAWLRITRVKGGRSAVRLRAGPPPSPTTGRTVPPQPGLPDMDPTFSFSMSDLDDMERAAAWRRLFAPSDR